MWGMDVAEGQQPAETGMSNSKSARPDEMS